VRFLFRLGSTLLYSLARDAALVSARLSARLLLLPRLTRKCYQGCTRPPSGARGSPLVCVPDASSGLCLATFCAADPSLNQPFILAARPNTEARHNLPADDTPEVSSRFDTNRQRLLALPRPILAGLAFCTRGLLLQPLGIAVVLLLLDTTFR
jgi:hypothetical protein